MKRRVVKLGGLLDWTMTGDGQRFRSRVLGGLGHEEFRRMLRQTGRVTS